MGKKLKICGGGSAKKLRFYGMGAVIGEILPPPRISNGVDLK